MTIKNAAVLTHYWQRDPNGIAPLDTIRDYLLPKIDYLLTIEHPFPGSGHVFSYAILYKNGKKIQEVKTENKINGPAQYIWQFFVTWYFLLFLKVGRFDCIVAINNLLLMAVWPFRWLGRIKTLVYYTIDYMDIRFENKILNGLYHGADRLACRLADRTWVVVQRQIQARIDRGVIPDANKMVVVPMAFDQSALIRKTVSLKQQFSLIYVGTLTQKQGVQLVIQALPGIRKKFPLATLTVIGYGDYMSELQMLTSKLKLDKIVHFTGYIGDQMELQKRLTEAGVGLAAYVPQADNFTYYADPSKVKFYLACGLPVIVTDVPALAEEVETNKAGALVEYTTEGVINGLEKIFKDYRAYKKAAIQMGAGFNKEIILRAAFENL